jgi:hypothetical protein
MPEREYDIVIATYAAAQTGVEVIAAPGAGKAIKLHRYHISRDAAGNAFFLSGSTQITNKWYNPANGGVAIHGVGRTLGENEALKYTSVGAANESIEVHYEIVSVRVNRTNTQ